MFGVRRVQNLDDCISAEIVDGERAPLGREIRANCKLIYGIS